ncbi:MAG: hypothetical protein ACKV0T_17395 [Planctomycetales bacterium]
MWDGGIELAVGDSVRLADQILTVIDIHEDEITFRLDSLDEGEECVLGNAGADSADRPPR